MGRYLNIGIAVICRYDTSTLTGKLLFDISGRPVLSYTIERVRKAAPGISLVVVTSTAASDDPIVSYCRRSGLEYLRIDDSEDELIYCIEYYGWDFAACLSGEELFLDTGVLRDMIAVANTDHFDFVSNVPGDTFPGGMAVEIIRSDFYRSTKTSINAKKHEKVFSWLYENVEIGQRYIYENRICPEASDLTLVLETSTDLEQARQIIQYAGLPASNLGLQEIYSFLSRELKSSPWEGAVGPLLIAEIGGNHEGDFNLAKHMANLAISCGADSVKFQLYRGNTLVSPVESADRNRHFKKFELTKNQHIYLAEMCRDASVSYSASVWDLDMLDWIDPYLEFYKIGSGDMTAWPILAEFARRGKPILLSTGLSTMEEILQTVEFLKRINPRYSEPNMLCILQCTSMYPIPDEDANLRVMDSLRDVARASVGYSDHTIGMDALLAAAAMGARVLEFHFTDDREGKSFRDHKVSLTPDEVQNLKSQIKRIIALRGDGVKLPQPSELANEHEVSFRRGVFIQRPMKAGELIKEDDLVFLRPAHGTDARDAEMLIGCKVLRDIEPFKAIESGVDYSNS